MALAALQISCLFGVGAGQVFLYFLRTYDESAAIVVQIVVKHHPYFTGSAPVHSCPCQ